MARVIVDATDAKGALDATKLQLYVADVAYDLWSLGVVLFHLVTGAALWNNNQNDDISSASDLRQLAKTWSENKARPSNRRGRAEPVSRPDDCLRPDRQAARPGPGGAEERTSPRVARWRRCASTYSLAR